MSRLMLARAMSVWGRLSARVCACVMLALSPMLSGAEVAQAGSGPASGDREGEIAVPVAYAQYCTSLYIENEIIDFERFLNRKKTNIGSDRHLAACVTANAYALVRSTGIDNASAVSLLTFFQNCGIALVGESEDQWTLSAYGYEDQADKDQGPWPGRPGFDFPYPSPLQADQNAIICARYAAFWAQAVVAWNEYIIAEGRLPAQPSALLDYYYSHSDYVGLEDKITLGDVEYPIGQPCFTMIDDNVYSTILTVE